MSVIAKESYMTDFRYDLQRFHQYNESRERGGAALTENVVIGTAMESVADPDIKDQPPNGRASPCTSRSGVCTFFI